MHVTSMSLYTDMVTLKVGNTKVGLILDLPINVPEIRTSLLFQQYSLKPIVLLVKDAIVQLVTTQLALYILFDIPEGSLPLITGG